MAQDGAGLLNRADLNEHLLSHLVAQFVSGGQTGADRAALDWAMAHEYRVGGWCPKGRRAEDGTVDERYPLREADSAGYRLRTRLNVRDSDGTLIVNLGKLEGGTLLTRDVAGQIGRPCLVTQLDAGVSPEMGVSVLAWLRQNHIVALNVAGPRESRQPGIYRLTWALLDAVETASRKEAAMS